jgi:hypothetical protein
MTEIHVEVELGKVLDYGWALKREVAAWLYDNTHSYKGHDVVFIEDDHGPVARFMFLDANEATIFKLTFG